MAAQIPGTLVLVNPATGEIVPVWRAFFDALNASISAIVDGNTSSIANLQTQLNQEIAARQAADAQLLPKTGGQTGTIGFHGAAPQTRLSVIGSKAGNAALRALIIQLATYGLITDNTT